MKTIYNVYVPIESQEQANRMKELCLEYELPIWDDKIAFEFNYNRKKYFEFDKTDKDFFITSFPENYTQLTEQEFIELLKVSQKLSEPKIEKL